MEVNEPVSSAHMVPSPEAGAQCLLPIAVSSYLRVVTHSCRSRQLQDTSHAFAVVMARISPLLFVLVYAVHDCDVHNYCGIGVLSSLS